MKARRMAHDAIDVFGSRVGVALLGTVAGIFLARGLGPHDRGVLALVLLLPSTLMTVTKLGITQANVYCVRRESAPVETIAANSLYLALALGLGCAIVTWLLRGTLLNTVMRDVPAWALLLALWRLPLLLVDNFFCGVLQAIGNFSMYNRRTLAGAGAVLVLVLGARFTFGLDLLSATLIYSAVTTVVVVSLLLATRRLIPYAVPPDRRLLAQQMRFGLKSYAQILTMHLLFRSDVYMVAYFLNASQTAFYSLALHFTEMILEIPQAVGWVIYPRMASLDKQQVHRVTAQACRRTILLTAVGGIGAIVLGPLLIPLWYGHAFAAASRPLAYATLGMVTMSIFTILSRDFTSRNEQTVNVRAGIVALVSNLALNVFMIPLFGISGAAVATSIAYSLAALMLLIPYLKESGIPAREVLVPTVDDVRYIGNAFLQIVLGRPPAAVSAQRRVRAATEKSAARQCALELRLCAPGEWDALLAVQPQAAVFHRMDWLRLVAQQRGAELRPYAVCRAGEVIGVFPVFLYRRGMFRVAASPPPQSATPYLGPLVPPEALSEVIGALIQQLKRARVSYFELRFPRQIEVAGQLPKGFQSETRATFVLDLHPGPDALWNESLNSACRRAVRKASASGVVIEQGDLTTCLDWYYQMAIGVFAKSHRPPSLTKGDYAALAALARNGGPVKVFLARHQGEIVAGGIFPYDAQAVYYLDGVSDGHKQHVRPNNLLHWEVIRWAHAHGLQRYDMVGAGIESVARFKRGFGPAEVPYTYAFRSFGFIPGVARSAYAFLAPTGRAVQHAANRLVQRGPAQAPAEAVGE